MLAIIYHNAKVILMWYLSGKATKHDMDGQSYNYEYMQVTSTMK